MYLSFLYFNTMVIAYAPVSLLLLFLLLQYW
jgi:hypothetical protein